MSMEQDNHLQRLAVVLDAYGADADRWPEGERRVLVTLVKTSDAASAMLADAARLDHVLLQSPSLDQQTGPRAGLGGDILSAIMAQGERTRASLISVLWPFGGAWQPVSLMAVAVVAGVMSGSLLADQQESEMIAQEIEEMMIGLSE